MSISREEILHLAKLSKLHLSDEEILHYSSQLTTVIDYFKELNEINTESVPETSQTTGLTDVFREDKVRESLSQSEAISESKIIHNGYIVVPAILER